MFSIVISPEPTSKYRSVSAMSKCVRGVCVKGECVRGVRVRGECVRGKREGRVSGWVSE